MRIDTLWRPFHVGSSPIDSQDNESWFPLIILELPNVGIPVLRTRNDPVGFRSPIDSSNHLIVLCLSEIFPEISYFGQFVFQFISVSFFGIDVNFVAIGTKRNLYNNVNNELVI